MKEGFYGAGWAAAVPVSKDYPGVDSPQALYRALLHCWCADTCAPRMRHRWSQENPTLGQCSITAFLCQDIFGGEVRGIPRPDGAVHCYNVVNGCCFDLTSEQFGGEALCYENNPLQSREVHFAKEEKHQRYLELSALLRQYCRSLAPVHEQKGDTI